MKSLITITFMLCSLSLYSQGIQKVRDNLSQPDSISSARIRVIEHAEAAALVQAASHANPDLKIKGYRIGIYSGNGQNARSMAAATMARFREMFPTTPAYMKYENPDWKVLVGNCITAEEAITLWGRVKNSFDKAYVMREELPISVFCE